MYKVLIILHICFAQGIPGACQINNATLVPTLSQLLIFYLNQIVHNVLFCGSRDKRSDVGYVAILVVT